MNNGYTASVHADNISLDSVFVTMFGPRCCNGKCDLLPCFQGNQTWV